MLIPLKIKSIKRDVPSKVYDIQTKKNHNFIANGVLVHNCIIFQEQTMRLCSVVAGFPEAETDTIRRNIMKRSASKKDDAAADARKAKEEFVTGAIKNGVLAKVADDLYEKILYFSGYGFNACVHFSTEVDTYVGSKVVKKQIQHIEPGDIVMTRDESTGSDVFTKVVKRHHNGVKKLYEVTLDTGEKVKCTMDHKFRTTDGRMLPLKKILEHKLSIATKSLR